jgi:prepilin-type N-terminal cleavage/methylation domain-containing protein
MRICSNTFRKYKTRADAGFTFIELMVVVLIISTLSVLGYVNYTAYNNDQRLKQTAQTLLNNLRLAQTDATAAKIPAICTNFGGYKVQFANGSPASYSVAAVCDSSIAKSYAIPADINFNPLPASNPLIFGPLTSGVNVGNHVCVILHSSSSNKDYTILIDQAGNINDSGFAIPPSCP